MDAGHNNHNETHNPEEHDHFNVEEGVMGSSGRFSEVSLGPQRSPGLRSESRVSEFSEGSTAGEDGRMGRQSEVSRDAGARSPGVGAGAVRRKPVSGDGH